MKKKLLIFMAAIGILGAIGYSTIANAKTTEAIKQTWDFKGEQVKTISVDAGEQDFNVELIESDSETTTVEVSGKVSSSALELLKEAKIEDGSLTLPLAKKGFKLAMTNEGKGTLTIKITTNLAQLFKKLDIDMMKGKVTVTVPDFYQGSFETEIYQGEGKVLGVPETTKELASLIRVSTADDILIRR